MVDYWTRLQQAILDGLDHVKLDVGEVTIGNVKIIDATSEDKVDVEKLDGALGAGTLNALMGKVKSFLSKADGTALINPATEEKQDAIKTAIDTLSGITGYDTHKSYDPVAGLEHLFPLAVDLGKPCEAMLIIPTKDGNMYVDSDIVPLTNPIKLFAGAEIPFGRKCSEAKIVFGEAGGVYLVAFA